LCRIPSARPASARTTAYTTVSGSLKNNTTKIEFLVSKKSTKEAEILKLWKTDLIRAVPAAAPRLHGFLAGIVRRQIH